MTDYTMGYCVGNTVILICATVSLVACTLLLVWHFTSHSPCRLSTYKKEATWIFIFLVIFEVFLFLRYFFYMYELPVYPYLLIINSFLYAMVCYLVCAVFT